MACSHDTGSSSMFAWPRKSRTSCCAAPDSRSREPNSRRTERPKSVTLILGLSTLNAAVQVSDRRLVNPLTGRSSMTIQISRWLFSARMRVLSWATRASLALEAARRPMNT